MAKYIVQAKKDGVPAGTIDDTCDVLSYANDAARVWLSLPEVTGQGYTVVILDNDTNEIVAEVQGAL